MAGMNDILALDRLPAMPALRARLIPMILDPGTSLVALERAIRQDEAITAAVLRLANSVKYGSAGKQFDLRQAIPRLGRDVLRRCVLEEQVSSVAAGELAAFGLRRGALWSSAFGGAIAAEALARTHAPGEEALAFVCGLLRDIGKLALNVRFSAGYAGMIGAHTRPGVTFFEAERAALGFDHAELGAALARKWNFPERVAGAIGAHHNPPPPGPGHDVVFDVVHAADTIARWAGLGLGIDGLEYSLAGHVRSGLHLDRRAAEREIALVLDGLREAEGGSEPATRQGAAA